MWDAEGVAGDIWAEFWSSQPCGICICWWGGRFWLQFNFSFSLLKSFWDDPVNVSWKQKGSFSSKKFQVRGVLCAIRNVQWKIQMMNLIFFFLFFFIYILEGWGSLTSVLFCVEWRGREGGRKDSLFEEAYCWLQSLVSKRTRQRRGGMKRREKHRKICWEWVIFSSFPATLIFLLFLLLKD